MGGDHVPNSCPKAEAVIVRVAVGMVMVVPVIMVSVIISPWIHVGAPWVGMLLSV